MSANARDKRQPQSLVPRLAERLVSRRRELGLKQADVAKAAGIAQSLLSRYESGEYAPPAALISALAQVLKTTPDYLLGDTDIPTPPATELTEDERILLDAYRTGNLITAMRLLVNKIEELDAVQR